MRQTPTPRASSGAAAVRPTPVPREPGAALPARSPQAVGGFRVLQNRAAPAQLSLFRPALPSR